MEFRVWVKPAKLPSPPALVILLTMRNADVCPVTVPRLVSAAAGLTAFEGWLTCPWDRLKPSRTIFTTEGPNTWVSERLTICRRANTWLIILRSPQESDTPLEFTGFGLLGRGLVVVLE